MSVGLDAWLEAMGDYLLGRLDGDALIRRIGSSPSGDARLLHYRTLVHRQWRGVLDHFHAAARRAGRAGDDRRPGLAGEIRSEIPPRPAGARRTGA